MFNEQSILKNALPALDSSDIVKSAGAVQNVKNWLKRLFSPEYKERVAELTERSSSIKSLLTDLSEAIEKVQTSIQNANVSDYEEYLNEVKILISYLTDELAQMENSAEEASVVENSPPPPAAEEPASTPEEEAPATEQQDYNVPPGELDKPLMSFDYFKNSSISISEKSKDNIIRRLAPALNKAGFPVERLSDAKNKELFFQAVTDAIFKGTLVKNILFSSEDAPKDLKEGMARIYVKTNVTIPELGLSFKAAAELGLSVTNPEKKLGLFRLNIADAEYTKTDAQPSAAGKKVLLLAVPEYANDEQSKKDIAAEVSRLKVDRGVEVHDVPESKVKSISNHYKENGYEVVGVEKYAPKVSASARKKFLTRLAYARENSMAGIPGLDKQSEWFKWYLFTKSKELGLNPECIAGVMSLESRGMDPGAVNPMGGASGLIQIMPAFSKPFGGIEAIRSMGADEQLERIVMPRFARIKALRSSRNCGDYYMANFLPAFIGAPDSRIVGQKGNKTPLLKGSKLTLDVVYRYNIGFDHDKDGTFTVGDIRNLFNSRMARWTAGSRVAIPDVEPPREEPRKIERPKEPTKEQAKEETDFITMDDKSNLELKNLERLLWASIDVDSPLYSVVKKALAKKILPKSKLLIVSSNINDAQLGLLCNLLNNIVDADTVVKKAETRTEISCYVPGTGAVVTEAVQAICDYAAEGFGLINNSIVKIAAYPFESLRRIG